MKLNKYHHSTVTMQNPGSFFLSVFYFFLFIFFVFLGVLQMRFFLQVEISDSKASN